MSDDLSSAMGLPIFGTSNYSNPRWISEPNSRGTWGLLQTRLITLGVNGDAAESFRGNLWVKNGACSIHYERVSAVYIYLLQTLIYCHLPRLLFIPPVQLVINS
jgi:hypothetical protein